MALTLIKALLSVATLAGMAVTVHAEPQESVPSGQQVLTAFPELSSDTKLKAPEVKSGRFQPGIAFAPAPALTSVRVYAIGSTNCGWEYPGGALGTSCDHGGAQLRAAVLEVGYGSFRVVWMNGGVLASSAMYASTPVCITNGYYSWPCTAGQTVVGFLNEYTLDGSQGGQFKYQSTSINAPGNTLSVQINIL